MNMQVNEQNPIFERHRMLLALVGLLATSRR